MKTRIKAIILSCLTVASFAVSGIGANASENDDENDRETSGVSNTGVNLDQPEVTLEEQLEKVQNDPELTEEERQMHIEKIEYLISVRDGTYAEPLALSPNYGKYLEVPFCSQEADNFCGPATTQQTYMFFKKTDVPSQTKIATAFGIEAEDGSGNGKGTDVQQIVDYIHDKLGVQYVQYWPNRESCNMETTTTLICNSIDNKVPPILWVSVSRNYGTGRYNNDKGVEDASKWPYPTRGHYLNASGYMKYGEQIRMTDPWADRVKELKDAKTLNYYVTRDTVYMVTNVVCV